MQISLVPGGTIYEAGVNTIGKIDCTDLTQKNYVVVPDAFSMQAEKLVFDVLDIKSTFNIEVVGISKLASRILYDGNIPFSRVSGIEEVFNIYQAVKRCENDFIYFEKCDVEFCQKILLIIKQFKSCKIKPEDIKPTKDELLNKKMHDLKLVYTVYQSLLRDKLDLSKLLEFSVESARNELDLSNVNLFFANFDSFSLEIGDFICKLAGLVNKVYIGIAKPVSEKNAYIYEKDIEEKVKKILEEYGVVAQVEDIAPRLSGERRVMAENLFAFNVENGQSDFFVNVLAKSKQDEIDFVAKYIRNEVYHGARFNDFAVVIPDEKYYENIKASFGKYGIVAYTDDAVNLSRTIVGRFLLKLVEMARLGFDKPAFQYLASSKLFGEDKDCLHDISFYQIKDESEFLERYPKYESIIYQIKSLKECKTISNYVEALKTFLDTVKENYKNLISRLDIDKYFKQASENEQALELVLQTFDKLVLLGDKQEFSLADFENILKISLQSVKVETIPSYIDAVFVGDVAGSYFEDVKVLFVLGANAKSLPKSRADTGIIDDDDIKKLKLNFVLEPEIKVLNRRSRLKLFECLQHAEEKLIVCCPIEKDDKISQFVLDLRKMFGQKWILTSDSQLLADVAISEETRFEELLKYLGNKNTFLEAFTDLKANGKIPLKYAGALDAIVEQMPKDQTYKEIEKEKAEKLFKKLVSVTALENYFSCPFRYFLNYSLGVKEAKSAVPDKRNFGNFEHALLCEFVSKNDIKNAKIDSVNRFLEEKMLEIAKKCYDEKVLKEKSFLKYLQNESRIILEKALYESQHSKFEPKYFELKVEDDFGSDALFKGFVDRVDIFKNNFRIIDYKTGEQGNVKDSLFCGKKLQLFLYAKMLKKKLGFDCSGVYYFSCQTKYNSKSGGKLLQGFTKKSDDIVLATDDRLENCGFRSDIVSLYLKKDGDYSDNNSGTLLNDFDKYLNYSNDVALKAIDEVKSGYIEPKPLESVCNNCPYASICKHTADNGERKIPKTKGVF